MDPNKVFISAPSELDWSTVTRFAQRLVDNNILAFAWDRNSIYDHSIFDECGSVLFLLPGNRFRLVKDDLPWGQRRELFRAQAQSKNIYVGYGQIYEADGIANTDGEEFISGISGTSNSIFTNIGKVNAKEALRMHKSGMNLVMNSTYGSFVNDTLYGELDHPGNGIKFNQIDKQIYESTIPKSIPLSERYSKGSYGNKGPIGTNGKPGVMGDDGYDYDVRLLFGL